MNEVNLGSHAESKTQANTCTMYMYGYLQWLSGQGSSVTIGEYKCQRRTKQCCIE